MVLDRLVVPVSEKNSLWCGELVSTVCSAWSKVEGSDVREGVLMHEVVERLPSAGWVAGVVGAHPWGIAMTDPRLQQEVWGQDPERGSPRRTRRGGGRSRPARPLPALPFESKDSDD